jgi:hypothetical protein
MTDETPGGGAAASLETAQASAVPAANHALTIPPRRLAGSAQCLNCGTTLQGPFCHYCGQPDRNFLRFFPVLLRELMEDFLDFDSRFMRTIKPLLFKPGKLTRDYLDGRRFRYTPPLRLYIFSSIACFFLVAILAGDAIVIDGGGDEADMVVTGIQLDGRDDQKVREALDRLDPETARKVEDAIQQAQEAGTDEGANDDSINLNGEPWDRETNPFIIEWLPRWVNDWINDEIEQSPAKGREIEENPNLIKENVFDVLPAAMFVLLPIVALLLKFWYLFAKKYYIEHLIFALHTHSFLFMALLISLLLGWLAEWAEPAGSGRITATINWTLTAVAVWVPVYFLVSLKRVYQQGWGMTVAKYCLVGISYLVLLGLTTGFVALLSFVLL